MIKSQLVRTYDSTHGKGSFDDTVSAFNAPDTVPDPTDPTGKTILIRPKVVGNSVILNPNSEKNSVTLPLSEAQTLAKQLNTRRIAQGLPPITVPGVDPTLGSSRANPIDVKTRLDGASVPRGRWIRTPTGADYPKAIKRWRILTKNFGGRRQLLRCSRGMIQVTPMQPRWLRK